jgi:hypothetical protein
MLNHLIELTINRNFAAKYKYVIFMNWQIMPTNH